MYQDPVVIDREPVVRLYADHEHLREPARRRSEVRLEETAPLDSPRHETVRGSSADRVRWTPREER